MLEQTLRAYLSGKPEAIEDYPFGPDAAVYKVQGKMFALVFVQQGECRVNLKCDPQEAMELRHVFDAVLPGYHMNKRHWNTVRLDGSLPPGEIERMVDNSYRLVVNGLTRAQRRGLALRTGQSFR
ncbi:MAG: MmcQ/YjbR family DNA-binding protein [Ketobacter sp.]|uniref:MmcQ/YjbR family DNA-binding protein n=1 Tax=unclassified Ketobacter TaxID=2639109 RepID=UPI000F18A503|nr:MULTISPECIES: MmcQ/YjbR family DNA-binding protein [unclassified Ketobacter]MCK5791348.1 MmcQ/YjbR family DNA-binding protein [Ketobacter sp.]RLT87295.1 MAG: MmcQ/YjbR family DNA-binding protein [Ketobacter sp. GenoA1]RLT93409.1 MAG: MmcQ/YjbR family DNA-binding protein [Ketobacter sp.]